MYPSLQRAAQENQRRTHKSKLTHTYVNTHIRAPPHTHTHTGISKAKRGVSATGAPRPWSLRVWPQPHLLVVALSRRVVPNLEAVQVDKVFEVVGVPSALADEQRFVQQEGVPGSGRVRRLGLAPPARPRQLSACSLPPSWPHPSVPLGLQPFSPSAANLAMPTCPSKGSAPPLPRLRPRSLLALPTCASGSRGPPRAHPLTGPSSSAAPPW